MKSYNISWIKLQYYQENLHLLTMAVYIKSLRWLRPYLESYNSIHRRYSAGYSLTILFSDIDIETSLILMLSSK